MVLKAIDKRLFAPVREAPIMPRLQDESGEEETVHVLLGCRSITKSVIDAFLEQYEPGMKVIACGGLPVAEKHVGRLLGYSGKREEAYRYGGTHGMIYNLGLKERFTSELAEGEYIRQQLEAGGVRPEDIIYVETESKHMGRQMELVKDIVSGFKGVTFYGFSPSVVRALETARVHHEMDGVAMTFRGVHAFGIDDTNHYKYPWLFPIVFGEHLKAGPEGDFGSYKGKFTTNVNFGAEAARVLSLAGDQPA